MNTQSDNDGGDADQDIAKLLEAAGPREELPAELKDRWETHFRAELLSAKRERRRRYLLPLGALAASVVALAVLLGGPDAPQEVATPMQILAALGDAEVRTGGEVIAADPGQQLRAGTWLETGTDARLRLSWAGFDVRLNQNTRLLLENEQLQLHAGELYLSDVGQQPLRESVTVVTPLGTVRDIGTQFTVRYDTRSLTASVREGSVELQTRRSTRRADAAGSRRTLSTAADGRIEESEDRSDWSWIYPVARRFELEGRSVLEFLQWSVTETGRELRFVDSAARLSASHTRFSGAIDISGIDPEKAVPLVLSTTRFEARVQDHALLVSRRPSE